MNYDGTTQNGIGYIVRLYNCNYRYKEIVTDLDAMKPARLAFLSGKGSVNQYSIGSRQLSRSQLSGKDLLAVYDKLLAEKQCIEAGTRPRKAVGVVLRDW